MKSNIVLIGFMGAGKTVIGKTLAKELDMQLVDMDKLIEKKAGMTINNIFKKYGEKHFRELETKIASLCSEFDNTIISTGGGVVLNSKNIEYLKKNSSIFLLWASVDTIYDRVKTKDDRPLLKVEDPVGKIRELLESRKEKYESSCDYKIVTDGKAIDEVSNEIKKIYINE